ncbi:hypothetical protein BH23THE1_BH23THE1_26330 [soil metagenome]
MVKTLFELTLRSVNDLLYQYASEGDTKNVQSLLSYPPVYSFLNYEVLLIACEKGHEGLVKILLTNGLAYHQDTWDEDHLLLLACLKGHVGVVEILLASNLFISDYTYNEALLIAYQKNNIDIIKMLLADDRFDPSFKNNFLLFQAIYDAEVQVIQLLLVNPQVISSVNNNNEMREKLQKEVRFIRSSLSAFRKNLGDNDNCFFLDKPLHIKIWCDLSVS